MPAKPSSAAGRRAGQPAELSLADALKLALHMHRMGDVENAERLYRRLLDTAPQYPDVLHFLGVLRHQRGASEEGAALIRQAISLAPREAGMQLNLGNVLVETGRDQEAVAAYCGALELAPQLADGWNNLGAVLRLQGRAAEALEAYQRAIALDAEHADAHTNLGNLYRSQGQAREAVHHYCKAITLRPHNPEARKFLGIAYYTLGEFDKAAEVYRHWLADDPGNPIAQHHLAACSRLEVPQRASDAYVERTFDSFADSFDAKLAHLGYRAPEFVSQAVAACCGTPRGELAILDAGCGTGLCGPLVKPHAALLEGVDLSAGMLERAARRGVYDRLVKAELTAHLLATSATWDVILSADTLCYFGDLAPVAAAAYAALKAQGWLLFTAEAGEAGQDEPGYRLNPNGRYCHASDYLAETLQGAGFTMRRADPVVLRMEGGKPVHGALVVAEKLRA